MRVWMFLVAAAMTGCGPSEADKLTAETEALQAELEAEIAKVEAQIEAFKPSRDWKVRENTSLLTDDANIAIETESQLLDGPFGSQRARLGLACREKRFAVFIDWPMRIYVDGYTTLTLIRFDESKPEEFEPFVGDDHTSFGWWSREQAEEILPRVLGAKRLVVRGASNSGPDVDAEFNVAGLIEHMPKLDAACPPEQGRTASGDAPNAP